MIRVQVVLTKGAERATVLFEGAIPDEGKVTFAGSPAILRHWDALDRECLEDVGDVMGKVSAQAHRLGIEYDVQVLEGDLDQIIRSVAI